jgi:hypothetical protein
MSGKTHQTASIYTNLFNVAGMHADALELQHTLQLTRYETTGLRNKSAGAAGF